MNPNFHHRSRGGVGFNQQRGHDNQQEERNKNAIWIGDLTTNDIDEMMLTGFFQQEPGFRDVKILKDKMTGANIGYGFIEFTNHDDADKFLRKFAGQPIPNFPDRKFRLNWASFGVGKSEGQSNSIFVGDLASDITDIVLFEVFKRSYKSCSGAKVVMDTRTQKSKGYGFVKFEDPAEMKKAITEMNGRFVLGRQIKVATAAKRRNTNFGGGGRVERVVQKQVWKTQLKTVHEVAMEDSPDNTSVAVGGLNTSVLDEDLFKVFSSFGHIENIKIPPSSSGRRGIIKFLKRQDAERAISMMNGKMIKDSTMNVGWGSLVSKQICVNTLVTENEAEKKKEKERKMKMYQYQKWMYLQQQKALRMYYAEKRRKIPGQRTFKHNFKNNNFDIDRRNNHFKNQKFGNAYHFEW